jgi:hypothetical protein
MWSARHPLLTDQPSIKVELSLSETPLRASTSGAGVAWLHIRFDTRPKYYIPLPYRTLRSGP